MHDPNVSSSDQSQNAAKMAFPQSVDPTNVGEECKAQSWDRLRRFFACNPFYLVSAALLLYSFYLVSSDRTFLPTEVGQLSFNLSSLQLYQIVVVITAILLARRAVWYDSTLLVGLENLLVLVPFILISQAALIHAHVVWVLCLGAGLLAALRLGLLRRFILPLNFPDRLAWTGLLMFAVNAALPALYRVLHESKFGTRPDWGAAYETNQYIWWLLVPALCALLNTVPWTRDNSDGLWPERHWLPLGLFSLWLIGSVVHLYCLGYVYDFAMRPELLAPALWTVGWVVYIKAGTLQPPLSERWRNGLWILPLIATVPAAAQPEKIVFLVLTTLNLSIFGLLYSRRRVPFALHLALVSLAALLGGLPEEWGRTLMAQFNRETGVAGAAVVYALCAIALSRDPKLGILGGLLAAVSVSICAQQSDATHWALQMGLVFLLLHSLRWMDSEEHGANGLRWLAALAWVIHSVIWTHFYAGGWGACLIAVPVLVAWFLFRWVRGKWGHAAILLASLLALFSAPGHLAAVQLHSAPAGLLAVVGSFLLFGLGTLGALTKHRWGT